MPWICGEKADGTTEFLDNNGLKPTRRQNMRPLSAALKAAGALALTLCAAAARAQASVIVNGSFESGLASWSTSGFTLQGYDYGIDNAAQSGSNAFYGGGIESLGFLGQS